MRRSLIEWNVCDFIFSWVSTRHWHLVHHRLIVLLVRIKLPVTGLTLCLNGATMKPFAIRKPILLLIPMQEDYSGLFAVGLRDFSVEKM